MESSCKDNYNVSDAFSALVEMTNHEYKKFNRVNSFRLKYKDVIENISKDKKKSKCCQIIYKTYIDIIFLLNNK